MRLDLEFESLACHEIHRGDEHLYATIVVKLRRSADYDVCPKPRCVIEGRHLLVLPALPFQFCGPIERLAVTRGFLAAFTSTGSTGSPNSSLTSGEWTTPRGASLVRRQVETQDVRTLSLDGLETPVLTSPRRINVSSGVSTALTDCPRLNPTRSASVPWRILGTTGALGVKSRVGVA